MKVKLTKLKELENALNPNNIEVGFELVREVSEEFFKEPEIGRRFNVGYFSTSGVQEIIDKSTFRTYNSIYRWEIVSSTQNREIKMKTSKESIESKATLYVVVVVFIILFTYTSYLYYAVGGEKNRTMREAHKIERLK